MPKTGIGSAITSKLALGVLEEWINGWEKTIQNVWRTESSEAESTRASNVTGTFTECNYVRWPARVVLYFHP